MTQTQTGRPQGLRQVVDWRAAVIAGLVAGVVFLIVAMAWTQATVGSAWIVPRFVASLVLGPGILPPPATFDATALIVGLLVHLILSVLFGVLIAAVVHRWGMLVAALIGAVIGVTLYFINLYGLSLLTPWIIPYRGTALLVVHMLYGLILGVIYEALERDRFEPINS